MLYYYGIFYYIRLCTTLLVGSFFLYLFNVLSLSRCSNCVFWAYFFISFVHSFSFFLRRLWFFLYSFLTSFPRFFLSLLRSLFFSFNSSFFLSVVLSFFLAFCCAPSKKTRTGPLFGDAYGAEFQGGYIMQGSQ